MRAIFLALVAVVVAFGTLPASAADERDVMVINATGYPIKFLGFNPPGDDEWNDNELGAILKDGDKVFVKFNGADRGCNWNLRVDWEGYDSGVLWRNVNLCTVAELTLHYNHDTKVTSFTAR
ncbi:MAG TPA: hypothetical protein VGZ49_02320 [Xanthobacteraceae bacterium]|jgi:hypothetical protein|nr:hypothetical protein [Xanthobacteraceae bacterium]